MTSIVSIITVFMATFVLVYGYLTYSDQGDVEAPAVAVSELDR